MAFYASAGVPMPLPWTRCGRSLLISARRRKPRECPDPSALWDVRHTANGIPKKVRMGHLRATLHVQKRRSQSLAPCYGFMKNNEDDRRPTPSGQ